MHKTLRFLPLFLLLSYSESVHSQSKYIDSEEPLLKAKVFAPGVISMPDRSEFGSVFNEKNDEFFFAVDSNGRVDIRYSKLADNKWTTPRTIISDKKYGFNDPFLSPDETRLYYISNKPRNEKSITKGYDIWYSNRTENGWSAPINAGSNINSESNEYYVSFTADGSIYFSSNKAAESDNGRDFDIYKSEFVNGKFQVAKKLNNAINSKRYEADVFIAPDESYIIFCSERKVGFGRGDLYISFRKNIGEWSNAINMGESINTAGHELCPFVTKDGKYFFYTSNQDIYWISTEIINVLRKE